MPFSITGDPIVYWVLKIILLLTLLICGYGISYKKQNYFNRFAITAGVVYSLIEGLRWDRGADYMHYYWDIDTLFSPGITTDNPEPIYNLWVNFFHATHIPAEYAFVVYSALLLGAVLMILKR